MVNRRNRFDNQCTSGSIRKRIKLKLANAPAWNSENILSPGRKDRLCSELVEQSVQLWNVNRVMIDTEEF